MIKLALLGNGSCNLFSQAFLSFIGTHCPYIYLSEQGYSFSYDGYDIKDEPLLICDCTEKKQKDIPFDLMVLKDGFSGSAADYNGAVIFNADKPAVFTLSHEKTVAISYGFLEKNSVTVSSVNTEGFSITVQRELMGPMGRIVEPQDIIFNTKELKTNISPYIAAAIVLQMI